MLKNNNQINIDIAKIVGGGYGKFWNDRKHRY